MLSVILIIFKIIGIAILVVLGILFLILFLVLFVPIRYRVKIEHGDSFALEGGVSWLFHLIHARISQSGSNRRIWLRIMGILIYDSLRPPKTKRLNNAEKKNRDYKKSAVSQNKSGLSEDDTASKDMITIKDDETLKADSTPGSIISTKDDKKEEDTQEETYPNAFSKDNTHKEKAVYDDIMIDDTGSHNEAHNKRNIFKRIVNGYRKIKAKIISFFNKIISKIKRFIKKLINIKDKAGLIYHFLNDDNNKKGFRFTYESIKKALKHILPKKLRSRLIFGTGDPCSTGQLLGICGILYGIYGDHLQITPDFENKVFKGSHYAKGRIRIWTLLIIIIKLLLDKRFKDLRTNYQLLKEAL